MIEDAKLDDLLALAKKPAFYQHSGERVPVAINPDTLQAIVQEIKDWRAAAAYFGPPIHIGFTPLKYRCKCVAVIDFEDIPRHLNCEPARLRVENPEE